jgi:glucose/mannose transport system substrate-binding protein
VRTSALAALLFGVSACSSSDSASSEGVVEIFSWWTSPGEKQALSAMTDVFLEHSPGVTVINAAEIDAPTARERLFQRLSFGDPPDTYQANIGADLYTWVKNGGADDENSKLEPLTQLSRDQGWASAVPPAVLDKVSYDGTVYAVPINVHRLNTLFYNRKIFADNGLTPPTTLAELYTLADTLSAKNITPLAVGSSGPWTLSELFFENLLPAMAGDAFYTDYFDGKKDPRDPEIDVVLREASKLWAYTNVNAGDLEWDAAVEMMAQGQAAMTQMGDWAKGYLEVLGYSPDSDFGEVPFPDTSDIFVFTGDSFPLPKGAPNRRGALDLLSVFGSVEGQAAFNPIKGSISARVDVDPSRYDSLSQQAFLDFQSKRLVSALSGTVPSSFSNPVDTALGHFVADPYHDPAEVEAALALYYDILQEPN